jgi:major outer membrane protein
MGNSDSNYWVNMKKLWIFLLTALLQNTGYALPVGNPWDASLLCEGILWDGHCSDKSNPCTNWCDAWSIRFGFYGDYVFERHLRVDEHGNHSTIHRTEIYTNAGYLALNFCDRIDLFGTVGATNIAFETPRSAFSSSALNEYILFETETYFSWSVGLRGTIWECGCFGIGAEAQYFYTRPKLNFVRDENDDPQYGRTGDRIVYHEWQVGLGAAYQYYIASCESSLVPYIAVKWARACLHSGHLLHDDGVNSVQILDLENDRCVGYAVGITLVGAKKASVTVEGRFADERAVHANAQFRF